MHEPIISAHSNNPNTVCKLHEKEKKLIHHLRANDYLNLSVLIKM